MDERPPPANPMLIVYTDRTTKEDIAIRQQRNLRPLSLALCGSPWYCRSYGRLFDYNKFMQSQWTLSYKASISTRTGRLISGSLEWRSSWGLQAMPNLTTSASPPLIGFISTFWARRRIFPCSSDPVRELCCKFSFKSGERSIHITFFGSQMRWRRILLLFFTCERTN